MNFQHFHIHIRYYDIISSISFQTDCRFKKGEEIISEGRFHAVKKLLKLGGRVQFELRIDDVQLDDEGTYEFCAANKLGTVSAEGSLKVTGEVIFASVKF